MANAVLNCSPTETSPPSPHPTHLSLSTHGKRCVKLLSYRNNPSLSNTPLPVYTCQTLWIPPPSFFPSCTSNPVHSTTQAHAVCYITCFLSLSWKALMRAASILAPPSHFFSHGWARHSSSVKRSLETEREKKDWFKDLGPCLLLVKKKAKSQSQTSHADFHTSEEEKRRRRRRRRKKKKDFIFKGPMYVF